MERIEISSMRRTENPSGRWMRSFCRLSLAAIGSISLLGAIPALAATSLDFVVPEGGQFSIDNGELTFTQDFMISVATVDGVQDDSLSGATVELDPIPLSVNAITPISADIVQIGVNAEQLTLSIRQPVDAGGALLATLTFVPGDLFVFFGTSGELSSEVASGQTGVALAQPGSSSSVLSSFAATADPIAIELGLSKAGQGDFIALFEAGSPVTGSASGSMAIIAAPEPSTAALTGTAMATLALVTGLRRRGRKIERPRT